MPSYAPRLEPAKKIMQLSSRKAILQNAIRNKYSEEKRIKAAEKYRAAQISLLKATVHYILEMDYKKKQCSLDIASIETQIAVWTGKTIETILEEVAKEMNKS